MLIQCLLTIFLCLAPSIVSLQAMHKEYSNQLKQTSNIFLIDYLKKSMQLKQTFSQKKDNQLQTMKDYQEELLEIQRRTSKEFLLHAKNLEAYQDIITIDQKEAFLELLVLALTINATYKNGVLQTGCSDFSQENALIALENCLKEEAILHAGHYKANFDGMVSFKTSTSKSKKGFFIIASGFKILGDIYSKSTEPNREKLAELYFFSMVHSYSVLSNKIVDLFATSNRRKPTKEAADTITDISQLNIINGKSVSTNMNENEATQFVANIKKFLFEDDKQKKSQQKNSYESLGKQDSDLTYTETSKLIFKVGILFAVFPDFFQHMKTDIENDQSNAEQFKELWNSLLLLLLKIQNKIDASHGIINDWQLCMRGFFNNLLATIVTQEFLATHMNNHEYLNNLQQMILSLICKNVFILQQVSKQRKILFWVLAISILVIGIGALIAVPGLIAPAMTALIIISSGASTIISSLLGSVLWDNITAIKNINVTKERFEEMLHKYISASSLFLSKISPNDANLIKQESQILIGNKETFAKAAMQITVEMTDEDEADDANEYQTPQETQLNILGNIGEQIENIQNRLLIIEEKLGIIK